MLTSILLLFLGLVGLYFGAEWLVRGAARMAVVLRGVNRVSRVGEVALLLGYSGFVAALFLR